MRTVKECEEHLIQYYKDYGYNGLKLTTENVREFPFARIRDTDGKRWAEGTEEQKNFYLAICNLAAGSAMTMEERLNEGLKIAKKQWDLFEKAVATGRHVLAHGRPGTGKSRYAFETARATQRRLDVINIRPNLPVDPLVGHYIPNSKGYFSFMYGVISMAMKEGGLLLVNEIDHAQGDAESIMHFALDDPSVASVTLPNEEREIIRPLPGYQVIATMNGLAQQDLSAPIYSRFSCKIRIDFPNPKAIKLLDEDLRSAALADYRTAQPDRVIPDLRMLFAFQELRKSIPPAEAAEMVFESQGKEFLSSIRKGA